MKKIFLILAFSFQLSATIIYADYQQSLKDYSYQFEQYRLAHQNYSVSKNKYYSYKTPPSLAEALENGKKVILLRDMVLITYFQTLKEKINSAPNISPNNLVTIETQIDTALAFISSNKDKAVGTISLYDLTNTSKELESKQDEFKKLSKISIGIILSTRLKTLKNNIDKNQDFLNFSVSQNKSILNNSVNLERWLIESKNKIILAGQKIQEAEVEFNDQNFDFSKGQLALIAGNQYLKEALNFQKEVIRGITND